MLSPIISYLLQMDRGQWQEFKDRLREEGLQVGDTIRALIVEYTAHGLPSKDAKRSRSPRKD